MGKAWPWFFKTLVTNSGLALGGLLLGVAALEGGLRSIQPWVGPDLRAALFDRAADEDLFTQVPGLGTMTRPNLDRLQIRINDTETIQVRTDNEGFRNPPQQKPTVAFLGDSFVWGFGVDAAHTWVRRWAERSGIPTGSYGQSGFSSWQYAEVYQRYVAPKKPRLVVWAFFANDLDPAPAPTLNTPDVSWRVWLDQYSLVYRLAKFIIQGAFLSDLQPVAYRQAGLDLVLFPVTHRFLLPQSPQYPQGIQQLTRGLAQVQGSCQDPNCQLVVVLIPTKEMVYFDRVQGAFTPEERGLIRQADRTYQQIQAQLTKQRIPYLDLTPVFQQQARDPKQPQLYFRTDGHWNRAGHHLAAEALGEFLENQGLPKKNPAGAGSSGF